MILLRSYLHVTWERCDIIAHVRYSGLEAMLG